MEDGYGLQRMKAQGRGFILGFRSTTNKMRTSQQSDDIITGVRIALYTLTVLLSSFPTLALNPSLDISQYAHTSWTFRNGFLNGAVYAIAQTPDGYLWLGTQSGVVRFDGVRVAP